MGNARAGRWPVSRISLVVTALVLTFSAVLAFEGYLLMHQADWLEQRGQTAEQERHALELAKQRSLQEYRQCLAAGVEYVAPAPGVGRSELMIEAGQRGASRFSVCYLIAREQFRQAGLDPADNLTIWKPANSGL
jgi:hypothetical protein